jgi:hypothetical protein
MNQTRMTGVTQARIEDQDFIEQFENCTLAGECFHHQDHVRLAWLYLCRHTLMDALVKFSEGLKRFALSKGKAGLYHETITLAFVLLIHERLRRCGAQQSWKEFADANPDLLDWQNNVLKKFYREETLFSEFARKVFVFPDKVSGAV